MSEPSCLCGVTVVSSPRDSISLFKEMIKEDGNYADNDTDHFENIQSTNYQTLRFKPPPPGGAIGDSFSFFPKLRKWNIGCSYFRMILVHNVKNLYFRYRTYMRDR